MTGVTVMRSPQWTMRLSECAGTRVENVTVVTNDTAVGAPARASWLPHQPPAAYQPANTDGLDVDSSANVVVLNSQFFAHDDGIVLKSGRRSGVARLGQPVDGVLVQNVVASSFVGAAFAIGSETSGGVRNVSVAGLAVAHTELALSVKTERGRGATIEDIQFEDVSIHGTACPALELNMMYHRGIPPGNASTTPTVRNILFSRVNASGVGTHAGFCMPLGAAPPPRRQQRLQQPRHSHDAAPLLALFQGLPESPMERVVLQDVWLAGPAGSDGMVQCANASVRAGDVVIDGHSQHIACTNG